MRAQAGLLAAVRVPPGVADLTDRITAADQQVAAREKQAADAADAEDEAERARDTLPDQARAEALARGYQQQRILTTRLQAQEEELTAKRDTHDALARGLEAAEEEAEQARAAREAAHQAHAAYQDAAAIRPVHTLSGGETFQASLALALAMSRQVVQLSAGVRDLNSMFLDEGFGTLDPETLDTVATTLERLAADKDRMVGPARGGGPSTPIRPSSGPARCCSWTACGASTPACGCTGPDRSRSPGSPPPSPPAWLPATAQPGSPRSPSDAAAGPAHPGVHHGHLLAAHLLVPPAAAYLRCALVRRRPARMLGRPAAPRDDPSRRPDRPPAAPAGQRTAQGPSRPAEPGPDRRPGTRTTPPPRRPAHPLPRITGDRGNPWPDTC